MSVILVVNIHVGKGIIVSKFVVDVFIFLVIFFQSAEVFVSSFLDVIYECTYLIEIIIEKKNTSVILLHSVFLVLFIYLLFCLNFTKADISKCST